MPKWGRVRVGSVWLVGPAGEANYIYFQVQFGRRAQVRVGSGCQAGAGGVQRQSAGGMQ